MNEVRQKRMSVPVDPEEGPHFGNDELASPSLMSDYMKDPSKVSASSCDLGQLIPDKEILDEDLQDCLDDWVVTLTYTRPNDAQSCFSGVRSLVVLFNS